MTEPDTILPAGGPGDTRNFDRLVRRLRRAASRATAAAKVVELADWREERIRDAEKRRVEARAKAAEELKARLEKGERPRGVDRVPARLLAGRKHPERGVYIETPSVGIYRGVAANYADRRAMGQRGKVRPPRRRELPGAVARRLERRRQEWTA